MVVYIQVLCPYCGSEDIGLHGKNTNGKQRLICKNKECSKKTFQLDYTYNAYKPGVKQQIADMAMNVPEQEIPDVCSACPKTRLQQY